MWHSFRGGGQIAFATREFMIDLEEFAVSLGCPAGWADSDLRRQAIRALKDLEHSYGLISVKFFHSKDAHVVLTDPMGAQFSVDSVIVKPDPELKHSVRVKFYRILAAYLASIKEDIGSISPIELARRFGVSHWTIEEARKAVK